MSLSRSRPRGRLRRNILLWFLVLSLAPLLVSNTAGYLVTRRIIQRQVTTHLTTLAEVEARYVAREIERHQVYLEGLAVGNRQLIQGVGPVGEAVRRGHQGAEVQALNSELQRLLAGRPLSELFIMDTTGLVIASSRSYRVGSDWSDTDVLRRGSAGRFFKDHLDTFGGVSGPGYRMASPILDSHGRYVGVLVGIIGVERAYAFLDFPEPMNSELDRHIVDGMGRLLYKSNPRTPVDYAEVFQPQPPSQPSGAVVQYINRAGVEVLGISVGIPGRPWRYVVETSRAGAFEDLRGLGLLAVLLEAAFALLLVGVVWLVARSIVSPLHRLVSAADRIRNGELGVQVQIQRSDELGDLGRTFDQMSRELQTSARQLEELHAQEMTRAAQLASVGELASGIAHEVKNPLVGLASGIDLLLDRMGDDPKTKKVLHQMRAETSRLESAIQDLLRYARPQKPRYVTTQPLQLIGKLIDLVQVQADAAGVRVEQHVEVSDTKIRVDPELFTQTLVNLALNGIQAMTPGGVLTLSTRSGNGEARIAVADTGAGIAEPVIDKIFRPFYTTKHRGTGLGLAISRGIVERHGGRIEVETELGRGSTFTVVIPIVTA